MDFNAVEKFSAENFDASNDAVASGESFLNQRGRIDSELQALFDNRGAQRFRRTKALDACAAAADVGFDDHGIADAFGGGDGLRRMIDDDGFGIRQTEFFKIAELQGFGSFVREAAVAVDDAQAFFFK